MFGGWIFHPRVWPFPLFSSLLAKYVPGKIKTITESKTEYVPKYKTKSEYLSFILKFQIKASPSNIFLLFPLSRVAVTDWNVSTKIIKKPYTVTTKVPETTTVFYPKPTTVVEKKTKYVKKPFTVTSTSIVEKNFTKTITSATTEFVKKPQKTVTATVTVSKKGGYGGHGGHGDDDEDEDHSRPKTTTYAYWTMSFKNNLWNPPFRLAFVH